MCIGEFAVIEGRILSFKTVFGKKPIWICQIEDKTGHITAVFFHMHANVARGFEKGAYIRCYGDVTADAKTQQPTLVHPAFDLGQSDLPMLPQTLTPVYPLSQGLTQARLSGFIEQALIILETNANALELLPAALLAAQHWPDFITALKTIHQPSADEDIPALLSYDHPAKTRLMVEELLAHQLMLRTYRNHSKQKQAWRLDAGSELLDAFMQSLPFDLTTAQMRVLGQIKADLACQTPMMRLLQGDVGAGKTVVAACALLQAVTAGYQAAFMAPTELLAEQHYQQCCAWFAAFNIRVVFLAGKLTTAERKTVLTEIAEGRAQVIIGTHALFQTAVRFDKLAFICIDEQHRFGVEQRLAFWEKGFQNGMMPHQLVMTATPIPRTLAMVQYADLDHCVLDGLPPGRSPVKTVVLPNTRRDEVLTRVATLCQAGSQVYWVCPFIEQTETAGEAVNVLIKALVQQLPNCCIKALHGRLSSDEKSRIMAAFSAGDVDVLIATTVIEVGVNVPNATLMVIEDANRMGLAQLHQLRGRVGRGDKQSFCILLYQGGLSDVAKARLGVLRDSQDGFEIAKCDLNLRGTGDLLGTRQSGVAPWRIVQLPRDEKWLTLSTDTADTLLQTAPEQAKRLQQRWYCTGKSP